MVVPVWKASSVLAKMTGLVRCFRLLFEFYTAPVIGAHPNILGLGGGGGIVKTADRKTLPCTAYF
jgi:hypothetical protein